MNGNKKASIREVQKLSVFCRKSTEDKQKECEGANRADAFLFITENGFASESPT